MTHKTRKEPSTSARTTPASPGRGFRLLLGAAVASRFADASRTAAFAVLAATLSDDPRVVSAVAASAFVPWVLFGLPAGALVDRWDKQRAFLVADLVRAGVAVALTLVAVSGHVTVAVLLVCAFALTTLQTVSDSCFNSLLPSVVRKERLGQANARLSIAQNGIGQFAGAPAGSALFNGAPFLPFLGNALCFFGAAAAVARLPRQKLAPGSAGKEPAGLGREVWAGLRWIATTPPVRALTVTVGLMNVASGLSTGMMPLYALRTLGMPPVAFGLLAGTSALAMIGGNFLAGRLLARRPSGHVSQAAVTLQILAFTGTALAPSYGVVLACVALQGFTAGLWNVPGMTRLMELSPDHMRGRVMAAYRTLSMGAVPAGAVFAGALAHTAGTNRAPFAAAALLLLVAAGQFAWARRRGAQ